MDKNFINYEKITFDKNLPTLLAEQQLQLVTNR